MYTLHTEKLRLIVPFMGNLKCQKAYGYDAFALQRVQMITQKFKKKNKKTTKQKNPNPQKNYKNNLPFYCPLIFLQWDAPLLCNNTCALLKDEEKAEEKGLHDCLFLTGKWIQCGQNSSSSCTQAGKLLDM